MIYVTSDLHGYPLEKFRAMLDSVSFSQDDFLYILGDVIDRGTDGVELLRWIMLQPNVELLLGNHEAMMLASDFVFEEITEKSISDLTGTKLSVYSNWVANGGQPTLDALRTLRPKQIEYILDFLRDCPLYETLTVNGRDFILTHSGLGNFSCHKKLSEYTSQELLWTRPSLTARYFEEITTVFGHTPTLYYGDKYKGKAANTETWINVDTGAATGLAPMLLRLDDMKEFYFE
ncbi:MAG: metallophosphoesterase [Clostridia bacterium]|nr:metallophosphoesterase [Clostridia bacterium]